MVCVWFRLFFCGGFGSVFSLFFWFGGGGSVLLFGGSVRLVIVFIFSCVTWLHIFFCPFFLFLFLPLFRLPLAVGFGFAFFRVATCELIISILTRL